MNNFAPVLIITLNRHVHFKRCVESLVACEGADKTDLYIGLDYPLNDSHWEGYEIIKSYLPTIQGFKTVNIVEREKNFGAHDNWIGMQNYIFEKYDRLIFSEDDNKFATSFLTFVNKGLDIYKDREDIFSISGYQTTYPMPDWYKFDAYLLTGFTAWGVGIWRNKWNKVDWSLDAYKAMLSNKGNYKILKKNYKRFLPRLLKIRDTGVLIGDGFLGLYMLHNKMYSVRPTKTRVINTGHDGTGENCGNTGNGNNIYMNQKVYEGMEEVVFPPDLQPDKQLKALILRQEQLTLIEIIKGLIPPPLRKILREIFRN
jgi:hypothetical protein